MSRIRPRAATIAGIVALDAPVAFVLTMMLLPLWSTIERRLGIESIGHSGPATWCFAVVFVCVVVVSLAAYLHRLGRSSEPEGRALR
jgi:hypothetical protein